MIQVEGLTKFYGPVAAIRDVTFTVQKGEIVGFLGPNGAGKTTTMRILACCIPASAGRARVAGYDVFEQSLEARRRLGYLPETAPLYDFLRVSDYLDFVAKVKGLPRSSRRQRVAEVMEVCGVTGVSRKLVGALSKGYRQRVGIAQALLNDPEVLILDEPTIGLDPRQIVEIRQTIKSLAGQRTVLLSTHILPEASMLCHRVIIINEGKLLAVATPGELSDRVQRSARILLQVEGPPAAVLPALERVGGVQAVERQNAAGEVVDTYLVRAERKDGVRQALSRAVAEGGWGLVELRAADVTLEEVFLRLVTDEPGA